jgi:hypothetical protein
MNRNSDADCGPGKFAGWDADAASDAARRHGNGADVEASAGADTGGDGSPSWDF